MPRLCSVCSHEQRTEIDTQLLAQVTDAKIAQQFGVSKTALSRHRNTHLVNRLAEAADRKRQANEAQADTLLQRVEEYRVRAVTILDAAEKAGSLAVALIAIKELRELLKLQGQIMGKLEGSKNVNVTIFQTREWGYLVKGILEVVEPYPDIRERLIRKLGGTPLELPPPVPQGLIVREERDDNSLFER